MRLPFQEKGKILDLWNLFYMAGILLLILFDLWLGCSYAKLAFGILLLFFSYQLCVSAHAQIVGYTILSIVVVLVKNAFFYSWSLPHLAAFIHQAAFVLLYFILRYCFDPEYDFFIFLKRLTARTARGALVLFVGKKTKNL